MLKRNKLPKIFLLISLIVIQFNLSRVHATNVVDVHNYTEFKEAFINDDVSKINLKADIVMNEQISRTASITIDGEGHNLKIIRYDFNNIKSNLYFEGNTENRIANFENIQFNNYTGHLQFEKSWTVYFKGVKVNDGEYPLIVPEVEHIIFQEHNEFNTPNSLNVKKVTIDEGSTFKYNLKNTQPIWGAFDYTYPHGYDANSRLGVELIVKNNAYVEFGSTGPAKELSPMSIFEKVTIGNNVTWNQNNYRFFIHGTHKPHIKIGDNFKINFAYSNPPGSRGLIIYYDNGSKPGFKVEVGKNFVLNATSQLFSLIQPGQGQITAYNEVTFDENAEFHVEFIDNVQHGIWLNQYSTITLNKPKHLNLRGVKNAVFVGSEYDSTFIIKDSPISIWNKHNTDLNNPSISKENVSNLVMTKNHLMIDDLPYTNKDEEYLLIKTEYIGNLPSVKLEKIGFITDKQNEKNAAIKAQTDIDQTTKDESVNKLIALISPIVDSINAATSEAEVISLYNVAIQTIEDYQTPDILTPKKLEVKIQIENIIDTKISEIENRDDLSKELKQTEIYSLNLIRSSRLNALQNAGTLGDVNEMQNTFENEMNYYSVLSDLADGKTNAINQLNAQAASQKNHINLKGDLSPTGKSAAIVLIDQALADGITNIESATGFTSIYSTLSLTSFALDEIDPSDLDDAKEEAKESLAKAVNLKRLAINQREDVSDEQKKKAIESLDKEYQNALNAISGASTYALFNPIFNTYQTSISNMSVSQDLDKGIEKAIEELNQSILAKQNAINARKDLLDQEKEAAIDKLEKFYTKALKELKDAQTYSALNRSSESAQASIHAIEPISSLESEKVKERKHLEGKLELMLSQELRRSDLSDPKKKTIEKSLNTVFDKAIMSLTQASSHQELQELMSDFTARVLSLSFESDLPKHIEEAKKPIEVLADKKREEILNNKNIINQKEALKELDEILERELAKLEGVSSFDELEQLTKDVKKIFDNIKLTPKKVEVISEKDASNLPPTGGYSLLLMLAFINLSVASLLLKKRKD